MFGTDYPTADGTCIRDYIHVSDLVRAHLDALRHLRGGGKTRSSTAAMASGFSVLRRGRRGEAGRGQRFAVRDGAAPAGRSGRARGGAERVAQVLGWRPRLDDLDTIVGHALAWEKRLTDFRAAS